MVNFDWSTIRTGDNTITFVLMMTDSTYPDSQQLIYRYFGDAPPGTAFLWRSIRGAAVPTDMPEPSFDRATWSVVIDPRGSATLYQLPNGQGPAYRKVTLDPTKEWHLTFLAS
jgi:hypothetical protein